MSNDQSIQRRSGEELIEGFSPDMEG